MHTIPRVGAIGLLLFFGFAAPAGAQWRWLEHMSGPGWYDGLSGEYKVLCYFPKKDPPQGSQAAEFAKTPAAEPTVLSAPCRIWNESDGDRKKRRRHTFGVSGSLLWSTINRLQYDPSVPLEDTQVWIGAPGVFYDWRPFGNVELGGSVEGFVFFGAAMKRVVRVASEARTTLNLWTVTGAVDGNPIAHVKLRIGLMKLNKLVVPADFGAVGGPGLDDPEWLTSARVVIDFECLPWRSRC